MTFYVENEIEEDMPFDISETFEKVARQVLEWEKCPYEAEISLLITDSEGIQFYNREYRNMDKETDVLSFPAVDYEEASDFSLVRSDENSYINPDTQELILGDIILNIDRVKKQAEEYGHSLLREYAFLLTHSMLHLLGYDHMEPAEEKIMFDKQHEILHFMRIDR